MITRNTSTASGRAFWAAAQRASDRVETWPAWKLGQLGETKGAEEMAKKKEVWTDNRGVDWDTEATALIEDLFVAVGDNNELLRTADGVAAIDALHEYAHRGDPKPLPRHADYREAQQRIADMKPGDEFRYVYGDGTVARDCTYVGVDVDPIDGETIVAYTTNAEDHTGNDASFVVREVDLIRTLVREPCTPS